jgi:hypothetical protein
LGGELAIVRTAIELAPAAEELGLAAVRMAAETMPSLSRSVASVAKRVGIVSKDVQFSLAGAGDAAEGSLTFGADGKALLDHVHTEQALAYRKADDLFFLYEPGPEPFRTSQTFLRGNLQNPGASPFVPIDRAGAMVAHVGGVTEHGWNRLTPKQLDAMRAAVPDGSIPIGLGSKRQAWLPPSSEHAVVLGPKFERPNVPNLLQPTNSEVIGDKQLEWFKFGESDSVTRADVKAVNHQIKLSGWHPDDSYTANYVRLMDGSVWRVDPEDLYPMSDRSWRQYLADHS